MFQQLKHLGDLGCLIKGGYTRSEEFKKKIKTFGPGFRLVYDLSEPGFMRVQAF